MMARLGLARGSKPGRAHHYTCLGQKEGASVDIVELNCELAVTVRTHRFEVESEPS
jgi:hypothetical protein